MAQLAIDGRSVIGASDGELATIRRERIGFVFQEFNLIPTLNAIENVMLPLRYGPRRPDGRARAAELLELVGPRRSAPSHRPTELSGGEQQRVAIARALVNEPAVILADEPTGELDSTTSEQLMATLRSLNRERGVTIIIVTHDAGMAGATDRVVRLADGRVVADERADPRLPRRPRRAPGRASGNGHDGGPRVWARLGDLLENGARPMIEAIGLGKRFRSLTAVHDLSFTVGDGEIFGLLGPNGAGKTTTVRMLSGLIAPTTGTARISGHGARRTTSQRIRAMTGVLTEAPGLHDKLTARQNLGYYGRLYGLRGANLRRAVDRYLGVVGLPDAGDRRVGGFSKGMRQKVAIARTLLHEPEVIYLDEPTSAPRPVGGEGGPRLRRHPARRRPLDRGLHPQPRRGRAALRPDRDHARHAADRSTRRPACGAERHRLRAGRARRRAAARVVPRPAWPTCRSSEAARADDGDARRGGRATRAATTRSSCARSSARGRASPASREDAVTPRAGVPRPRRRGGAARRARPTAGMSEVA